MLSAGTVVDEKFEILQAMAMGGFGVVYKARQLGIDRIVALKVLQSHQEIDQEDIKRFEREARILSSLKHRNLVLFYGFGHYQGDLYIAMELIHGKSLEVALAKRTRLPLAETLSILKQVCEALICAHSHGVVHRDLKPTNIMLIEAPEGVLVKLIDFGLAKLITTDISDVQKITEAGNTVGSVEYMSPEQCLGRSADDRSDIYSLGCVLQHCLTGDPPFTGDHTVTVMKAHVDKTPPRLAESAKEEIACELQFVVDKALAKVPDDRYADIGELLSDLDNIERKTGAKLIADGAPIASARRLKRKSHQGLFTKIAVVITATVFAVGVAVAMAQYLSMAFEKHNTVSSVDIWYKARSRDMPEGSNPNTNPIEMEKLKLDYLRVLAANDEDHLLDQNQVTQVMVRLTFICRDRKEYVESMKYGEKAIVNLIHDPTTHSDSDLLNITQSFVDCGVQLHEYRKAESIVRRVIDRLKPGSVQRSLRQSLAAVYESSGEFDKSMEILKAIQAEEASNSHENPLLMTQIHNLEQRMAASAKGKN